MKAVRWQADVRKSTDDLIQLVKRCSLWLTALNYKVACAQGSHVGNWWSQNSSRIGLCMVFNTAPQHHGGRKGEISHDGSWECSPWLRSLVLLTPQLQNYCLAANGARFFCDKVDCKAYLYRIKAEFSKSRLCGLLLAWCLANQLCGCHKRPVQW